MGKEAKIGLGVVAILAIVLGVVVFRKVWGSKDIPTAAVETPADDRGESGDGKSGVGGEMLIPASGDNKDANSGELGKDANDRRWVGPMDKFSQQYGGGRSIRPRTELMPKANSTFGSGTQNLQRTESPSGDRFGDPRLRQRDGFGTGGTNQLRPNLDDGASNTSSRRQYSDDAVHQADPILGGLRPTTPAQLQPGPDGLQTAAQSTDMQAQYAVRQPAAYGTRQAQTQYGGSATAQQDPARNSYSGDNSVGTTAGRYDAFQPSTASRAAPNASRSDAIASDGFGQPTGLSQNTGSYTVKPNDSFWSVSKKAYGTGDFYKALIEHNRQKFPDPSKIRVGDVIATPAVSDLRKNYPVFCPKERKSTRSPYRTTALAQNQGQQVYVVQEGDTIFNIARDELGKTARWADICELNRDLLGDDYDHLKPGWKLVLPLGGAATVPAAGDGRQDSLTRQIWSQIK